MPYTRLVGPKFPARTRSTRSPGWQGDHPTAGDYRADTTLAWAGPGRAPAGWRSVSVTSDGLRLLQDRRRSLLQPPRQFRRRTVTAAELRDL